MFPEIKEIIITPTENALLEKKLFELFNDRNLMVTETDHKYFDNEKMEYLNLPSITSIVDRIFPFNKNDDIPEIAIKMGQLKGTCIHKAIEELLKQEDYPYVCDHEIETHKKGFDDFKEFWEQFNITLKNKYGEYFNWESEISLKNATFCGTLDIFGWINLWEKELLKPLIIEIKTTSEKNLSQKDKEIKVLKENYQLFLQAILIFENTGIWVAEKDRIVINTTTKKIRYANEKGAVKWQK